MTAHRFGGEALPHAFELGQNRRLVVGDLLAPQRVAFEQASKRSVMVADVGERLRQRKIEVDLPVRAERRRLMRQFLHRPQSRVARRYSPDLRQNAIKVGLPGGQVDGFLDRGARLGETAERLQDLRFAAIGVRTGRLGGERLVVGRQGVVATSLHGA